MTGWLIVNEFLYSSKFNEIHQWLLDAANRQGILMQQKTNAQILVDTAMDSVKKPEVDFVLFWDKDIRLARYLEQLGYSVFNSSEAIGTCDDKSLTHLALMKERIRMPRTILAPMTYENIGYTNFSFLERVADLLGFPMIVKECFGSFGQQVYLVKNYQQLKEMVLKLRSKKLLFQEYIATSFGRDLRLQVVGDQVIASMYRYSENGDFRANLTLGGNMKPHVPTQEQEALAVSCCKIIGLDFAGVDLLFGKDGEPIVCEVNSNAHFKNIYDCTGVNAADAILAHIKKQVQE
ncbi:MAG: RimK family alpha-L-glutamate ligase [Clostridiales bacterium]|nr:RimK family alpha-L-glutamate ligase [Clostridiales bacterium]